MTFHASMKLETTIFLSVFAFGQGCLKKAPVSDIQKPTELLALDKVFPGYIPSKSPLRIVRLGDIVDKTTGRIILSVDDCIGNDTPFLSVEENDSSGTFEVYIGRGGEFDASFFSLAGISASASNEYVASFTDLHQQELTGTDQLFLPQPCRQLVKEYTDRYLSRGSSLRMVDGVITGDYTIHRLSQLTADASAFPPSATVQFGSSVYEKKEESIKVTNAVVFISYPSEGYNVFVPSEYEYCSTTDTRWHAEEYQGHCYFFLPSFGDQDNRKTFTAARNLCESKFSNFDLPVIDVPGEAAFLIDNLSRLSEQFSIPGTINMENAWIGLGCNSGNPLLTNADVDVHCSWVVDPRSSLDNQVTTLYKPDPNKRGDLYGVLFIPPNRETYSGVIVLSGPQSSRGVMCEEK